jgi:hypothetical protein
MTKRFFAIFLCLISMGCVSTGLQSFYNLDLRDADLPIMLNQIEKGRAGRELTALVFSSDNTTTTYYSGVYYDVAVSTTNSEWTTTDLRTQIFTRLLRTDSYIQLGNIYLFHHYHMAPYYNERATEMAVDLRFIPELRQ